MRSSLREIISLQRKFKQTALHTDQLEILGKTLKIPYFVGVYAADQHLYIHNPATTLNHTWICNTDPSTEEGTHWIGVKHFNREN